MLTRISPGPDLGKTQYAAADDDALSTGID
jgi:hypothetical protein